MPLENYSIDGSTPRTVETPETINDLARIVASAAKENAAIIPWGGGTMQHLGNAPRRYDIAIDLTPLNCVVEYAPDDLTITVDAGATIAAIQTELTQHNQFLPLDPPLPARATIGGTLATNANGPLRLRYGPARDFTLGMSVVNAEGKITKSGGKVVKNVAGYEMAKLNIGAFGTLGIISQVTFKVYPKPPEQITLVAAFNNLTRACKTVRALWNLTTAPLAIEILDTKLAKALGFKAQAKDLIVAARFGGTKTIVDAASLKSGNTARNNEALSIEVIAGEGPWQKIADLPVRIRDAHPIGTSLRISLPPSQLKATIEKITERTKAIGIDAFEFCAHTATAVMYVAFDADEGKMVEAIKHLRWALAPLDAHLIVEHAPRAVKEKISVWGDPGVEHFIAQRLKEKFDPQWILNPGRFVGGL